MKEDRLESFVRNNRDSFDHLSPSPEVWNRISKKQGGRQIKTVWFKTAGFRAASIIVFVLISSALVFRLTGYLPVHVRSADRLAPEIRLLIEAEAFYAQQVSGKLKEIRKCYQVNPELQMEIEGDLMELETMYNELKRDLKENMANKNVIEAMIENNRYRLRVVNDVLAQINC
jgi:hypothetical protein